MFFGETLSLIVALSWTATALFAEVASKRIGSLPLNITRMVMSLLLLAATLWLTMGTPWPRFADSPAWTWLLLSGVVGYVIGDYCLMQGYILIGSRIGQLFMTLSAPTAAIFGRILIGERMQPLAIVGMVVTLSGIALSILSKDHGEKSSHKVKLNLPLRGIAYAAMAGICQGCGLVLSKVGLQHYEASIAAVGLTPEAVPAEAIIPLPLSISVPFAATMIRTIMGLTGFFLMQMLMSKDAIGELRRAAKDRKSMLCALGSTMFGPFIGVSLSLMATLYTSAGIAQTIFALTPVLIIAPAALLFHQKVTPREVLGAIISVAGVSLFFI